MQVAIEIRDGDGTPVTTYEPKTYYYVTTRAYNGGVVHAWMHASFGMVAPDASGAMSQTHRQATNCAQASFSLNLRSSHGFLWVPDESTAAGGCVTLSVAQAESATDYYHTATVRCLEAQY